MSATARTSGGESPALSVRGLRVTTGSGPERRVLLHGIDLEVGQGERVGLIGESGSGKSMTALAVLGLLPEGLHAEGSVRLGNGPELLGAPESVLSPLRGDEVAMVFQEPMTALNPLMTVGRQVAEAMTQHGATRADARRRAVELLDRVRLPDPARAASAYPHQLSGGQRQRVVLAMAMANRPRVLLADEPTTALDVTVQAGVLALVDDLVRSDGSSLLFISHDLAVVASVCDRVLVMFQGRVVEHGPVAEVLRRPQHAYTRQLLVASDLAARSSVPSTAPTRPGHSTLGEAQEEAPVFNEQPDGEQPDGKVAVRVRGLTRDYRRSGGPFRRGSLVHGLRGVSFDVAAGQRFGVVGESGSGKSTLLRLLCALDTPTAGEVRVAGTDLVGPRGTVDEARLRQFRRDVQIVFQDPMGSLDPRMRVGDIVAEPLRGVSGADRRERVAAVLTSVGLPADTAERHPHQFSGGQRQRISIARALVTRPKVLVADEPVSALDVSVRATVLDLLDDLVTTNDLTLVLVSHDLGVVRAVCDTVAVVSDGRIVECGPTESVYRAPQHTYTRALVAASPSLENSLEGSA